MKPLLLTLTLGTLATGCAPASQVAICDGTAVERDALADALLEDGGDASVVAGERLIARLDAGCN